MAKGQTSLNELNHLRRWIWSECSRNDIDVQFRDDIPGPCTNKRTLLIPTFNERLTVDDEAKLRFFVRHELSHHIEGSEYLDLVEDTGLHIGHPLGAICNILEDQRIEKSAASRYVGDERIISDGREILGYESLQFTRELVHNVPSDQLADDTAKMSAMFLTAGVAQSQWCPGASVHMREELELSTSTYPNISEYVNKLHHADAIKDINNLGSGDETIELAKKLYGLLWDKTPEEVEQEMQELRKGEGKGESEESEENSEEKKAGKHGKVGKRGDGKPAKEGQWDERTGKYTIPYEFFVKTQHEPKDPHDPAGHGLGLDYAKHRVRKVWIPEDLKNIKTVQYHNNPKPLRSGYLNREGGSLSKLNTSTSFANRVRRYLQVKSATLYMGGHTKGTIHNRALYRAALPIVGDGDWNRRVFRKKYEADLLDTSVSLLVDMSGSMNGPKVVHATKSAMLINHVISNVLRVNTEILTFSEDYGTIVGVIKPFSIRATDEQIYSRFDDFTSRMWGNADADAINFAYDRLLQQQTKRKVLIVLSDGSPADGIGDTDPYYALKYVVQHIEEQKRADIIGIGIMDKNVMQFYKKHVVIQRADELEDGLLKVISYNILNGGTV